MLDEIIDITDEHGQPTGQTIARREAHEQRLWHNVTAVWIINNRNSILSNQLGQTKDLNLRGRWSTTIGGHVVPNESPHANVVREIKEEIGVNVKPENLIFVCSRQSHNYSHIQHVFIWECDLPITAFTIDNVEITAIRWVSKSDYLRDYAKGLFNNTLIDEIKNYLEN